MLPERLSICGGLRLAIEMGHDPVQVRRALLECSRHGGVPEQFRRMGFGKARRSGRRRWIIASDDREHESFVSLGEPGWNLD